MLFADMKDEITIYTPTRNAAAGKDEYIRMYLSKVYVQSTRGVKTVQHGLVSSNNYVCLIPYFYVDAHGKEYIPFYDYDKLPIEDRHTKFWTLKATSRVFIGLINEPEVVPDATGITISTLISKYNGRCFTFSNFDDFTQGSEEIQHAAIGGV